MIVSAKHGPSPIDPAAIHDADDGALIGLRPAERAARLPEALAYLEANSAALGVGTILPFGAR